MSNFKTGDKVRVIDAGCYSNIVNELDIYTIRYVDTIGYISLKEADARGMSPYRLELVDESKLKTKVSYILLPDSVTLSFDAQAVSIKKDDHRYSAIIKAIREKKLELIPTLVDVALSFSTMEGVELVDGKIKLNGKDIPEVVSDRVISFKENDLPIEPLIKFAEKLMLNPSFSSRKMLYKFLERNEHPITTDGNFIAYRKVRVDFTDLRTGKMDNSIGKIVEMNRSEVDDDPTHYCSDGLHVAAYNYASNFSKGHLIEVEINPEDVVAVPNDYDGEKMRVCKFKVVALCESRLEDVHLYDHEEEYDADAEGEYFDGGW